MPFAKHLNATHFLLELYSAFAALKSSSLAKLTTTNQQLQCTFLQISLALFTLHSR